MGHSAAMRERIKFDIIFPTRHAQVDAPLEGDCPHQAVTPNWAPSLLHRRGSVSTISRLRHATMPDAPPRPPDAGSSPPPSRRLAAITEAFGCPICHATLRAAVLLPCEHMFCSECVRRHLSNESACPQPFCRAACTTSHLVPLRALDAALETVRGSSAPAAPKMAREEGALVFLSKKDPKAKRRFLDRLRENGLPTTGSLDTLAARDREFVIRWNANLDAAVPQPKKRIADQLVADENHKARERRKAAHAVSAAFFAAKVQAVEDPQLPIEGDGFNDLIRKIRVKRENLKRERREADDGETLPLAKVPKHAGLSTSREGLGSNGKQHPSHVNVEPQPQAAAGLPTNNVNFDYLVVPPAPPSRPSSSSDGSAKDESDNAHETQAFSRQCPVAVLQPSTAEVAQLNKSPRTDSLHHTSLPQAVSIGQFAPFAQREATNQAAERFGKKPNIARSGVSADSKEQRASKHIPQPIPGVGAAIHGSFIQVAIPTGTQTPSPAKMPSPVPSRSQNEAADSGGPTIRPSNQTQSPLTDEQRRRIQENRNKCLERRIRRLQREKMRQPDF